VYLDASSRVRAERRHAARGGGVAVSIGDVGQDLVRRGSIDASREPALVRQGHGWSIPRRPIDGQVGAWCRRARMWGGHSALARRQPRQRMRVTGS
jgi:hypothetical protein